MSAPSNTPHDFTSLKNRHRAMRDGEEQNFNLRVHRALSWLQRAEASQGDDDVRFICLWIAFNAAYAGEIGGANSSLTERESFRGFIRKLCRLDTERQFTQLLWQVFAGPVKALLDNAFVYQPFWDAHNGKPEGQNWNKRFAEDKQDSHAALGHRDAASVLELVFDRLYTLRNQLMHGGATWNGSMNREQLRDACNLLTRVLGLVLDTLLKHPAEFVGQPFYPPVQD